MVRCAWACSFVNSWKTVSELPMAVRDVKVKNTLVPAGFAGFTAWNQHPMRVWNIIAF